MGGSDQWKLQRAQWAGARELITPDLPGFGSNAALQAPDTIGAYARFVLAKLDHQGVRSFDLLGHSMGGMIVQEMIAIARTGEVGGVVLISGTVATLSIHVRKLSLFPCLLMKSFLAIDAQLSVVAPTHGVTCFTNADRRRRPVDLSVDAAMRWYVCNVSIATLK